MPSPTAEEAGPRDAERRYRLFLAGLLGTYLLWAVFYVWRTSFLFAGERVFVLWDDAMISMQYARNLSEGHGLVWIPGGDPVQGFSNLGVTLLMALFHWLPLAPAKISLAFQVLNGVVLVWVLGLTAVIARRLFPGSLFVPAGAIAATALSAPLAVWSLQGSDVGFVALWVTAAVAILARRDAERDLWPTALTPILVLGLLVRPDTGLAFVVFVSVAAFFARRRLALLAGPVAALVAVEALLLGLGWWYYGDPLPNTWYLKATGAPRALVLESAVKQMGQWLPWVLPAIGLAAAGVAARRSSRGVWQCGALLASTLAYNFWVGGDWLAQYGGRFFTPLLPLLFVLASGGAWWLCARLREERVVARATVFAACMLAVGLLANPPELRAEWFTTTRETMIRSFNIRNYARASYLREHTALDTLIAVHWAGVSPYFSRRPAFDVLGKTEPHIARLDVQRFEPGHSKWDWDYTLEEAAPDLFVSVSRGLKERTDFRAEYLALRSPHLDEGRMPMYLRRDRVGKLRDDDAVLIDLLTSRKAKPDDFR